MCCSTRTWSAWYTLSAASGGKLDRRAISESCQWLPRSSASSGQTAWAILAESSGQFVLGGGLGEQRVVDPDIGHEGAGLARGLDPFAATQDLAQPLRCQMLAARLGRNIGVSRRRDRGSCHNP